MKKTMKFLSLVLALVMVVCIVPLGVSAASDDCDVYGHNFSGTQITETNFPVYIKSPATCYKPTEFYKYCTSCGVSSEGTPDEEFFCLGATLSHNYVSILDDKYILVNATCVDRSIYTKSCAYCGTPKIPQGTDIFNPNTVVSIDDIFYGQAVGHDFKITKAFKDSTCVTEGNYEEFTCMRVIGGRTCGFKIGGETIPKKEHAYKEVQAYRAPTCKTNGQYGENQCTTCNKTFYFDANGNIVDDLYVASNPLQALGHIDYNNDFICDRCNAMLEMPEPEEPEYKIENGYYYIVNNGTATVLGVDLETKDKIVIPSTLGGYPVTAIGEYAFSECFWLTEIVIPDTVKTIGEGAFAYCIALKEIIIPENVTSIGDYAFGCCISLEKLIVKNRNTTIGNYIGFSDAIVKAGHTAEEWVNKYYAILDAELNGGGASDSMYDDIIRITDIYDDIVANPYLTIYGYEPSSAKTFATANKINFKNISEYLKKDVDKATGVEVAYPEVAFNTDVEFVVREDGTNANIALGGLFMKYKSYDISFISNGSEVQPNGKVTVKLPVPDGYSANFVAVYYINAFGVKTRLDSKIENGYVIFETDHFSEYVVVDESSKIESPAEPDEPDTPDTPTEPCTCKCHGNFIQRLIFKITNFFAKLFNPAKKICACGVAH